MKRLIQWAAVAVVVVCMMTVARQPEFWKRYLTALVQGPDVPLSFYEPRELVEGDNRPPAPRVGPALEMLDVDALQAAADYASKFNSDALMVTRHGHIVFERYWNGPVSIPSWTHNPSCARSTPCSWESPSSAQDRLAGQTDRVSHSAIEPRCARCDHHSQSSSDSSGLDSRWSARERFGTDIASEDSAARAGRHPGGAGPTSLQTPIWWRWPSSGPTKERYAQYLSEALWRRLGAADGWLWLDRAGGMAHADCCLIARQGDWVRLGELLASGGRFEGDEIVTPKWVAQMLVPAKGNSSYGGSLKVKPGRASEAYALQGVFAVEGRGNRMWLVPSMSLVILRTGGALGGDWDDSRIPNLIIRGARDVPPAPRPGDLRGLVPNH